MRCVFFIRTTRWLHRTARPQQDPIPHLRQEDPRLGRCPALRGRNLLHRHQAGQRDQRGQLVLRMSDLQLY